MKMASKKSRVEIRRKATESSANLIRRFSRRVQQSGILAKAKKGQFSSRPKSDLRKKREALKKIEKRKEIEKLKKLGKIK